MAWYRAGSVSVTNGSAVVTGAGTSFVANVQAGHAINLPDGRAYEVLSVDSNTQLTLGSGYLGGTAGGQAYSVQPNQGFAQTAATRLSDFLSQVSGWVSGALAGRFGDGSSAAPGVSFAADQDTGLRRIADNVVSIVTGGVDRLFVTPNGLGIGQSAPGAKLDILGQNSALLKLLNAGGLGTRLTMADTGYSAELEQNNGSLIVRVSGAVEAARFDTGGNLLVGVNAAANHTIAKSGAQGAVLLHLVGTNFGTRSIQVNAVATEGFNGANAALFVSRASDTSRSINAAGTINASGADYAEYIVKADGCGAIGKGDVCGVDVDGKLTKSWAAAISFVVKSTDPAYVGGDIWAAHLAPRPIDPGVAPAAPILPPLADDATAEDREAAAAAYRAATAAYAEAKVAHDAAVSRYEAELPVWGAELEAARQCVDRIAFAGQVPVNITGDFAVGDYLIAVAKGSGIRAAAVAEKDITFEQYRRRLGKVWAIRDGRPWVDVQHG